MNANSVNSVPNTPLPKSAQWKRLTLKRFDFKSARTKLNAWLRFDSPIYAVILLLIVMLLAGCHTQPTAPCVEPALPTKPALRQPLPKESYSISVERDLSRWQQMLTVTPPTSKP